MVTLFYLAGIVAVIATLLAFTQRHAVHALLYLVVSLLAVAVDFYVLGAVFVAALEVMIYAGAIMVIFVFVVMMLNIDFEELRSGFMRYLPVGAIIGAILFVELMLIGGSWVIAPGLVGLEAAPLPPAAAAVTNTRALGDLLYTRYIFAFQVAGLILLVAMIGAIVLTLRQRVGVRRQSIPQQLARTRAEAVALVKVPLGGGAGSPGE